ncbi:MAG: helix-turn-helix domain-containing protein [Pseudobacter sp.]|uniref:helix-turn-helix domain-containing protein n=1 Tax=Pseudobacter sp. TaxID=2045420 RepID=UPI003F7E6144
MSRPTFYTTKEGRAHMAQFVRDHQYTHSVDMIHKQTGASPEFIKNIFIELDIEPLTNTDLYMKFLLENHEMSPEEAALTLGITSAYVYMLLNKKPSPRLKQVMKLEKQTA